MHDEPPHRLKEWQKVNAALEAFIITICMMKHSIRYSLDKIVSRGDPCTCWIEADQSSPVMQSTAPQANIWDPTSDPNRHQGTHMITHTLPLKHRHMHSLSSLSQIQAHCPDWTASTRCAMLGQHGMMFKSSRAQLPQLSWQNSSALAVPTKLFIPQMLQFCHTR